MRRSKEYRLALAALKWDNGTSRWDVSRCGCFHCGVSPSRSADLKRNVCVPCRTLDFTPIGAPASNPMAKGYRVCTDHCTTVPLPLKFFANGNKKCLACLEKRRLRKMRKRDPTNQEVVDRLQSLAAGRGGRKTTSLSPPTKRRRKVAGPSSSSSAALVAKPSGVRRGRRPRALTVVPEMEGEEEEEARVLPTRRSARAARSRIAAIRADLVDEPSPITASSSANSDDEEWDEVEGEEDDDDEDEDDVDDYASRVILPISPSSSHPPLPTAIRVPPPTSSRVIRPPPPLKLIRKTPGYVSDSTIGGDDDREEVDAISPFSVSPSVSDDVTASPLSLLSHASLPRLHIPHHPPPQPTQPHSHLDWSSAEGVATPRVLSSPFPVPTLPLPLSPTPAGGVAAPAPARRSLSAPATSRPLYQPFSGTTTTALSFAVTARAVFADSGVSDDALGWGTELDGPGFADLYSMFDVPLTAN